MPYHNNPYGGVNENPIIESPYFQDFRNDIITPTPPNDLMITEGGDYMISQVLNEYMETE